MRQETGRNIIHLALGTVLAAGMMLLGEYWSIILLSGILLLGVVLCILARAGFKIPVVDWFLNRFERKEAPAGKGTINFFMGTYLSLVLFGLQITFVSVLILSFLDSFSTVIGMAFGKTRINGKKTAEGTLAGFFAGWIVSSLFLPPLITLPACVLASLVELYSRIDDNIVIPLVSGASLFLTTILF